MIDNYFQKCHILMNKLSKQKKQMIKLQLDFVDLKKENEQLREENNELKELIKLIADADSYREENSVKEILRNEIWGIDSVAGEYASAWHDCVILSNFFEKYYGEHWDNDKFD